MGFSACSDSTHCLRSASTRGGQVSGTSLAISRGMNATPPVSPSTLANEAAQANAAAPSDSGKQSTNAQGFAAAMDEASPKPSRKPAVAKAADNGRAGGQLPVAGNPPPPAATTMPPVAAAAAVMPPAAGAAMAPQSGSGIQSTAAIGADVAAPTTAALPDPQAAAPGAAGVSSPAGPLGQALAASLPDTADGAEQLGATSAATTASSATASTTATLSASAAATAVQLNATATIGATSTGSDGVTLTNPGATIDSVAAADSAAGLAAKLTDAAATASSASGAETTNRSAATLASAAATASSTAPAAASTASTASTAAAAAAATTQAASTDPATFLGSFLTEVYQPSATTATPTNDVSTPGLGGPTVAGVSGATASIVQSALTAAFVPAVAATLNTGGLDKHSGGDSSDAAPIGTASLNDGSSGAAQLNASVTAGGSTDPTPAVTVRVNAGVDTPEFSEGLADRVSWMVDSNLGSAKLQVNPPQLGPIEIRIAVQGDSAQVSLTTHSGVTRDALESSVPKLREMLGAQGFGQVSVDISQRSFQDRSASAQPYDWTPSSATNAPVAAVSAVSNPASRISSSAVDAYA